MKSLPIVWQRLVSPDGKTCDRCSATYQEMQQAVSKLKEALRPLSIEPTLEVREIDQESFEANVRGVGTMTDISVANSARR
jgi:hypothetical protein